MVFVRALSIQGFRGVAKLGKPLEFKRMNVILGRNNSTKSTILQALSLVPHPYLRNLLDSVSKYDNLSRIVLGYQTTASFQSLMHKYVGSSRLDCQTEIGEFELDLEKSDLRCLFRNSNFQGQLPNDERNISNFIFQGSSMNSGDSEKNIEKAKSIVTWVSLFSPTLLANPNRWAVIENSGAHVKLAKYISTCLNEKFSELVVRFNEIYLRKETEGFPFYVRLGDNGLGVQRALGALLLLESVNPLVALWDDFEEGMHPSMVKIVLEYLAKSPMQVVLATHSLDVLYALSELKSRWRAINHTE